ncbi:MAG TPA: hypothetical protein VNY33_03580, partial [Gaiellaceae bacterium]|nr:hypothetical protein [Gaiellaceae bacterium]
MSHFSGSPVLTIAYDPSGPTPTAIYYLDPVHGPVALPSTVDTVAHTISAALPHFSMYFAGTAALSLTVSPAVVANSGTTTITATVKQLGQGAQGAVVSFTAGGSATFVSSISSCTTIADGTCAVQLTDSVSESVTIGATVGGSSATASATVPFVGWNTTVTGATPHTITVSSDGTNIHVNVDGTDSTRSIASVSSLGVVGSDAGDTFVIDSSVSSLLIPIHLAGGTGNDTLQGPDGLAAKWLLTGTNIGTLASLGGVASTVTWNGIENLKVGNDSNSISFSSNGGLTGGITGASATIDVGVGGFVHFSGTISFQSHAAVGVTLSDGSHVDGVSLTTVGLNAGSIFVGADAGTPSAAGFQGTIQNAVAAFFSKGDQAWQAVTGTFDAGVTGITGLTASVTGMTVKYNSTAADGTWLDLTKLDLAGTALSYTDTLSIDPTTGHVGTGTPVALDFSAPLASAHATIAQLSVGGFVAIQGGFDLTSTNVTVTDASLNGGTATAASLLGLSVSGGDAFIGSGASFSGTTLVHPGATGFYLGSASISFAVVKPLGDGVTTDQTSFIGLEASIGTADLEGVPGFALHVTGATAEVNRATDAAGAASSLRLDWAHAL